MKIGSLISQRNLQNHLRVLSDESFLFLTYLIYILIGGQDSKEQDHSAIWKYDSEQKVWKLAMYMRNVKSLHGVSVVNYNDFC